MIEMYIFSNKVMSKVFLQIFLVCFNVVLAKDSKESNKDEEFKCPEPNGNFAHPDCTKYYACSWDRPIVMDCPAGLHWNDKIKSCDWPQNAGCLSTDKPNEPTNSTTPETTTVPKNNTFFETTFDDCMNSTTTDQTISTESTQNFFCPQENGLHAHKDCWKFWLCSNWIAVEEQCHNGLGWNDDIKRCDWPSNFDCYLPDSNPDICKKSDTFYRDKNDCSFYYHCDLSYRAHLKQCFKGLYFDENKRTCVYPKYTNCYDESDRALDVYCTSFD